MGLVGSSWFNYLREVANRISGQQSQKSLAGEAERQRGREAQAKAQAQAKNPRFHSVQSHDYSRLTSTTHTALAL